MSFPTDELSARISELSAHLNAATCHLLELIAEFDEREGWADEGCQSCAHWLNWKCGVANSAAREKVRVARAIGALPLIRDAFARGEVSYSKVRAMTRVATPENEEYLLMIAHHGTAAHLERVVRGYRKAVVHQELEAANERHDLRSVQWYYDEHGMLVVQARLTPEQGARFIEAVDATMDAMARERDDEASARVPHERPSFAARRADALLRLVDGDGADTEIIVHVARETLADDTAPGCCELEHGPSLAPETARRLACDAGVVRLVEEPDGQPLDVGRKTRSIPPALRRALQARDGGCRFPGCDAVAHVEGHHVTHWARGGETSLANVVYLCRFHHRLVHEGGFNVVHRGDGVFRFLRPGGEVVQDTIPRIVVEGCPTQLVMQANRARGIDIDAETGVTLWDGLRMDEAMAVEGVLEASGKLQV